MESPSGIQSKFDLITRRIAPEDIHGIDLLRLALQKEEPAKCIWATSPTGHPHIGYFIPMIKFAELIKAGVEIVIILGEIFAFLDHVKYPMEQVSQRMVCYKYTIIAALQAIGVPLQSVRFVEEASFIMTPPFLRDFWRLCAVVPQQAVRDAWNPGYSPEMLGPMLCSGLQALSEEYCNADIQFGGTDQRGIFDFIAHFMPLLGFADRARFMNPMLPNLSGQNMSSSDPPETKIMLQDPPAEVVEKIRKAYLTPNTHDQNGVFAIVRDILLPMRALQAEGILEVQGISGASSPKGLVLPRSNGMSPKEYHSIDEIKNDLEIKELSVESFVTGVADAVNHLLDPIRQAFDGNIEWQVADKSGYPVLA